MGCWVSYGLGSLNENLPTFVVLPDHRGFASNGPKNWDSAFLPASIKGQRSFPGTDNPIADLFPPQADFISPDSEPGESAAAGRTEPRHAADRPGDAAVGPHPQLRTGGPDAARRARGVESADEPQHILKLYGLDTVPESFPEEINPAEETDYFARKCLVARRLLERGVRFVQIWSGNDNGFPRRNWDSHEDVQRDHGPLALGWPAAPRP